MGDLISWGQLTQLITTTIEEVMRCCRLDQYGGGIRIPHRGGASNRGNYLDGFITSDIFGLWEWKPKQSYSLLIKRLLDIKNSIFASARSTEAATQILSSWFDQLRNGTHQEYDFFRGTNSKVPLARIVWRQYLQSSHAFTLWLLVHRRLPTKGRRCWIVKRKLFVR